MLILLPCHIRSYLRNGENFIQFIGRKNRFASIEGSYTLRTSDRRYHTIVYEIPLDDFDYNGMAVKGEIMRKLIDTRKFSDIFGLFCDIEYEISTEENYFRSGVLQLAVNGTFMDVKFFVNKNGFHVADLQIPGTQQPLQQPQSGGVQRPFGPQVTPQRVTNNQVTQQRPTRQQQQPGRFLNPTFSRPDLLTGQSSIQPGR